MRGGMTRTGLLGGTLALALLVSACGGSSSPSAAPTTTVAKLSGSKIVLASASTTVSAGSAKVALSVSGSGGIGSLVSFTADGVEDFSNGNSQLTMHFGGALSALMSGDIEVRSVDKVAYIKMPASMSGILGQLTNGKPWFSIDASKLGGKQQNALPGVGQSDPTQFLAYLETVSDNVTKVGSEAIRGVDTTHYHVTFDLAKAVNRAGVPASLRGGLSKALGARGAGPATIPADVFIDASGRLRRLSMQLGLPQFGGSGGSGGSGAPGLDSTVTTSIDLYDFGTPVDVQAPPADQIAPLPMFGMNGGGAFGSRRPAATGSAITQ